MEKNLGHATAYGYAKSKGYSGTEDEFAQLMADYASVGQSAAQSAEQAAASATSASGSAATATQAAQTATDKASEAVTAADTATTKASEASQSASTASAAATSASTSAQTATTAAATATTKASETSESAATATTAKTDAESARDAAAQSASEAAASAESIDPDEFDRKIYAAFATDTASGAIASFPDGADDIPMKDVLVHIEPVQAGSGDPSPDNVRPITGWTAAKVTRTGKNLYSKENGQYNVPVYATDGTSTSYADVNVAYIPVKPNTEYTIILQPSTKTYYVRWVECDENKGYVWRDPSMITSAGDVFTKKEITRANTKYLQIAVNQWPSGNFHKNNWEICIQEGTDTEYHSYSGSTYDITFPTEAGTVYGGTLDVTKGKLVVDRAMVDLVTLQWMYLNNIEEFQAYMTIREIAENNQKANMLCSAYQVLPYSNITDKSVAQTSGANPRIRCKDSAYTDAVAFKTAMSGVQLVYELAIPITYQLTPQEITSLLGTNNLWADTGDSEVEYRADTKMYITKKITEAVSALS